MGMQGLMLLDPASVKQGYYSYPSDRVIVEVPEILFVEVI